MRGRRALPPKPHRVAGRRAGSSEPRSGPRGWAGGVGRSPLPASARRLPVRLSGIAPERAGWRVPRGLGNPLRSTATTSSDPALPAPTARALASQPPFSRFLPTSSHRPLASSHLPLPDSSAPFLSPSSKLFFLASLPRRLLGIFGFPVPPSA